MHEATLLRIKGMPEATHSWIRLLPRTQKKLQALLIDIIESSPSPKFTCGRSGGDCGLQTVKGYVIVHHPETKKKFTVDLKYYQVKEPKLTFII